MRQHRAGAQAAPVRLTASVWSQSAHDTAVDSRREPLMPALQHVDPAQLLERVRDGMPPGLRPRRQRRATTAPPARAQFRQRSRERRRWCRDKSARRGEAEAIARPAACDDRDTTRQFHGRSQHSVAVARRLSANRFCPGWGQAHVRSFAHASLPGEPFASSSETEPAMMILTPLPVHRR